MLNTFTTSLALSIALIVCLKPIAANFGLVDRPCDRKQHEGVIPLVGGLAIYATLLLVSVFSQFWGAYHGIWMMSLGLLLLLTGLVDDLLDISATHRFIVEIFCCMVAILFCNIRITDVGQLLPGLGGSLVILSIPMTVVGMVGAINAFNMTDGLDGLAGGLAVLTLTALAYFAYPGNMEVCKQILSIAAALCGFLIFNSRFFGRKKAAIFMGDSGSIFIGFVIVWYLILLSQGTGAVITPVSALWLFAVPLIDTLSIMIRRIRQHRSPFASDREHLHHILQVAGFGPNKTVLIILSFQLVCVLGGIASIRFHVPDWITFGTFVVIVAIYYIAMVYAWKVNRLSGFAENPVLYGVDVERGLRSSPNNTLTIIK